MAVKKRPRFAGSSLRKPSPSELLKETEENFRTFFQTMGDMLIVGKPDGKILFSNRAMSLKLGYTVDELQQMHVLDLHPVDKRAEADAIFAAMLRGESDVCPLPLQKKDGSQIPVETRIWLGKWSGMDCIFGMCKDLSLEQEALQKFDRLFRNNPASMAVSEIHDRRFVDVNAAFLHTLGYTRDEIIGRTAADLGLFVQQQAQDYIASQVAEYRQISNVELKVRGKDGNLIDGLFSGEVIESQGRQYFLTVMIDQTERCKLMEDLRDSQMRYQAIIEDQTELICRFKPDGILTFVNNAYCQYFGKNHKDLLGKTFMPLIPEEDHILINKAVGQISVVNPSVTYEHRVIKSSGEICWQRWTDRAIYDNSGNLIEFQSVGHDITEIKAIELERLGLLEELKQNNIRLVEALEKAREGGRAKSAFLAAVSHELRTPLTSIVGLSQLLEKQYYGKLNNKQTEYIQDILTGADHLVNLINNLLDLTKIESGKIELVQSEEKISEIIEASLKIVEHHAASKGINIRSRIAIGESASVIFVDKLKIIQILVNLLSNAIKFSNNEGEIVVEVQKRKGNILFSVSDKGVGIEAEIKPLIFDLFYVGGCGHTKQSGAGIGLPLAKQLAVLHKGDLWCESEGKDKGSIFYFSLPVATGHQR